MFQCPKCNDPNKQDLRITHTVMCITDVAHDEEVNDYSVGDLEWSDTDQAECLECSWLGTVADISIEDTEEVES